jgi:hypothetical protein
MLHAVQGEGKRGPPDRAETVRRIPADQVEAYSGSEFAVANAGAHFARNTDPNSKFRLHDVDRESKTRMIRVKHVILPIDVFDINIIGVEPPCRPRGAEPEPIAAVLEPVIVELALIDMETVRAAETGAVMGVRNTPVIAASVVSIPNLRLLRALLRSGSGLLHLLSLCRFRLLRFLLLLGSGVGALRVLLVLWGGISLLRMLLLCRPSLLCVLLRRLCSRPGLLCRLGPLRVSLLVLLGKGGCGGSKNQKQ